jgi:hypothetical protein
MRFEFCGSAVLGSALLITACAPAPQQGQEMAASGRTQCFRAEQVNDFNAINDETVLVTVGANTTYQLGVLGTCPNIDWSQRIGIRSRTGGSWVCHGHDAEMIVPSASGIERCPVTSIRLLSPEEARALRSRPRG